MSIDEVLEPIDEPCPNCTSADTSHLFAYCFNGSAGGGTSCTSYWQCWSCGYQWGLFWEPQ